MASVNSVSSTSSLYGTRNVISGLASGMDTESMIQNAVSGYQSKITALQQKRTKLEWQQEAYRSMITKAAGFSSKYASYTSTTNLASPSFFSSAITVTANGANKDKVSATGKTNSTVQIDRVLQMASAARYASEGAMLGDGTVTAAEKFNLSDHTTVSNVSGSIQIGYGGGANASPTYFELDLKKTYTSAQELYDDLSEQIANDSTMKEKIEISLENGEIQFKDKASNNSVRIWNVFGDAKNLGIDISGTKPSGFKVDESTLTKEVSTADHLKDATMTITLDGQTKTIKGPTMDDVAAWMNAESNKAKYDGMGGREAEALAYTELLQSRIDNAFGTMKNADGQEVSKLKVENVASDKQSGDIQLKFAAPAENHSTFTVTSNRNSTLGLGGSGMSNNTSKSTTLKQLAAVNSNLTAKKAAEGERADEDGNALDADGKKLYQFNLNGVDFEFNEDTAIESLMNRINNSEAGVKVTYSQTTGKFSFEAKETGSAGRIAFSENMEAIFGKVEGAAYTAGQDAVFTATVNNEQVTLTRSSNTVDLDGLKVTLKGTFGYETDEDGKVKLGADSKPIVDKTAEAVSFTSSSDADKIIDVIKQFVEDYNALATEVKGAYSTLPLQKSSGAYYEPLTEDDEADMSDNAVEKWNEKAKTGMLFGDNDLANFYRDLTSAATLSGENASLLRSIGIETSYSNGLTTLKVDEKKLRAALESNPDRVSDIFTKSKENGASSDGLMASLAKPLDQYAKTTGYPKGILVEKAGSVLSPSNLYTNVMQKQLDALDKEIQSWQDKMSDRVDFYTSKFSSLEQLVANMNSQSSLLSQMMGS